MKGKQLFHGVEIKEWAIVSFAHPRKCSEDNLRNFTLKLTRTGNDSGMPVCPQPCFIRYARNDKEVHMRTKVDLIILWVGHGQAIILFHIVYCLLKVGPLLTHIKASFKDVQLIIVVLNGKSMVYGKTFYNVQFLYRIVFLIPSKWVIEIYNKLYYIGSFISDYNGLMFDI